MALLPAMPTSKVRSSVTGYARWAWLIGEGQVRRVDSAEMGFGYDQSRLQKTGEVATLG